MRNGANVKMRDSKIVGSKQETVYSQQVAVSSGKSLICVLFLAKQH